MTDFCLIFYWCFSNYYVRFWNWYSLMAFNTWEISENVTSYRIIWVLCWDFWIIFLIVLLVFYIFCINYHTLIKDDIISIRLRSCPIFYLLNSFPLLFENRLSLLSIFHSIVLFILSVLSYEALFRIFNAALISISPIKRELIILTIIFFHVFFLTLLIFLLTVFQRGIFVILVISMHLSIFLHIINILFIFYSVAFSRSSCLLALIFLFVLISPHILSILFASFGSFIDFDCFHLLWVAWPYLFRLKGYLFSLLFIWIWIHKSWKVFYPSLNPSLWFNFSHRPESWSIWELLRDWHFHIESSEDQSYFFIWIQYTHWI